MGILWKNVKKEGTREALISLLARCGDKVCTTICIEMCSLHYYSKRPVKLMQLLLCAHKVW